MISAAIVGLGWWGRTIATTLAASDKLRLVRAVDTDPRAGDWARERGLSVSVELGPALDDPTVEALILCTPHSRHREQILRVAQAGKHVFCEKPLALTRRDAVDCVAACEAAGVVLGIGHERRFEPPILELRRLAASGELGTLLQIEANFSQDKFLNLPADNWRLSSLDAPGGPMTATGIHLLDLAVALLGPAERVAANVRQLGSSLANGDTLGALIGFKSGANALIGAMLATPFVGRFALHGNRGWVEVVDKAHPESPEGWTLTRCFRDGRPERTDYPPAAAVRANLEAFADAIAGRAPYPVPHADMVATIAALEAVVRSARNGGRVEAVD
ncbi:MAG TPA: Gfo/Idh/MocA family oxidoreductase [Stellaceae bacterium]|jgi:predicted dehydrogenase|nr:Gfo/Idh/MocA family oxidoreductase [Stellaceae bacterium]